MEQEINLFFLIFYYYPGGSQVLAVCHRVIDKTMTADSYIVLTTCYSAILIVFNIFR
jgi:hypothetical protein